MEQIAHVQEVLNDGKALVRIVRQSACSGDCHKCAGCGAVEQQMLIHAQNLIGARPGDKVVITSKSAPVLKAAAVLYLLPMALFFLGYVVGAALWQQGAIMGCVFFVLGIGGVILYDRRMARKQDFSYTITGYAEQNASDFQRKGDIDLD